ncbi:aminotransferase class IV [Caloranaerobacter ferrireducens]|uniref:aminotransferase class IV n=1 Tax=Caloranaerobacter ferrireducens TaxID=1323370 RepID=UPI0009F70034|nr:aminotransferase class IV [Caloranaerobacter ferrireducens]
MKNCEVAKMLNELDLNYCIVNGKVCLAEEVSISDLISSPSIYEVIRVIDGVPLYVEEHLLRMRESAQLLGFKIKKSDNEILNEIKKLITVNKFPNLNIKLVFSNLNKSNQLFLAYFIKSYYPEKEVYEKGIHTILFNVIRENPNAKIVNMSFKERVKKELEDKNAFEALLVNEDGYITEGSRSNIFFVIEDKVYTAPEGEVLQGITRERIFKVSKELGIEIIKKHVHVDELKNLDGAFMTGTSVNVLPIRTIDEIKLDSVNNKIIKEISLRYINDMEKYIESRKNLF